MISAVIVSLTGILAFPRHVGEAAAAVCRVRIGQPLLADSCASLGIPGLPSREERVAWGAVAAGDCEGLRTHIKRFPKGAFRESAQTALSRRHMASAPIRETTRMTGSYVRESRAPFSTEAAAIADARARALASARDIEACGGLASDPADRLVRVDIESFTPECRPAEGGHRCGMTYRASCVFQVHPLAERCD